MNVTQEMGPGVSDAKGVTESWCGLGVVLWADPEHVPEHRLTEAWSGLVPTEHYVIEASADTDHDHIHLGQDQWKNCPQLTLESVSR